MIIYQEIFRKALLAEDDNPKAYRLATIYIRIRYLYTMLRLLLAFVALKTGWDTYLVEECTRIPSAWLIGNGAYTIFMVCMGIVMTFLVKRNAAAIVPGEIQATRAFQRIRDAYITVLWLRWIDFFYTCYGIGIIYNADETIVSCEEAEYETFRVIVLTCFYGALSMFALTYFFVWVVSRANRRNAMMLNIRINPREDDTEIGGNEDVTSAPRSSGNVLRSYTMEDTRRRIDESLEEPSKVTVV